MVLISTITILIALVAAGNADPLLRVHFSGRDQAIEFRKFADERNLDIWIIDAESANVRVPESVDLIEEIAGKYSFEVLTSDVFTLVDNVTRENDLAERYAKRFRSTDAINTFFHKFEQVMKWLNELQSNNKHVTVRNIGLTYEKRPMNVIRIAADGSPEGGKPAIFLTGGIHAREWLSVATLNYMINEVIKLRNNNDARMMRLLNKFDFYFLPVTNPDGYAYTHQSRYTRMWRKTRRPNKGTSCVGSDPNRNFDVDFGQRSASRNPCSDIYPGPYPFSEVNTQHLRDFAKTFNGRLKLYYDVHSYSQMYFVPFAYNSRVKPKDDAELRRVGLMSRAAIQKVNGRRFTFGPPGSLLYDASGSTMDWFLLKAPAKYSYALELYPGRGAWNGFIVPPSAIVPSGREILEGLFVAAENIKY